MPISKRYRAGLLEAAKHIPGWERLNGKTVLVTGAGGLIGSAIVDMLLVLDGEESANIRVAATGRDAELLARRFMEGGADARQMAFLEYHAGRGLATVEDADFIVHCAGIANTALYASMPVETLLTTVEGMRDILEYAKERAGRRVLFVSSGEIYGRRPERMPFREEESGFVDPMNPRACYPSGRRAAETLCVAYRKEYGVDVVIARPGHVYGPMAKLDDQRASSQFPRNAVEEGVIHLKSAGTALRSCCHVADVASAVLTILLAGTSGEAYNIAVPGIATSIRQMAEAFASAAGARIVFEEATEREKLGYNLMDYAVLDAGKLSALGWKALFDMKRGAEETVACLREMKG